MISFGKRFEGNYRCYKLPVGRIYHFDTRKIHTLFNEGDSDRVTLLIDLKTTMLSEVSTYHTIK